MPDFEKIIDAIIKTLGIIFKDKIPPMILQLVGYSFLIAIVLCAIWGLLFILSKIRKTWREEILPMLYNADEKKQRQHRQQFADHIESEIRRLNNLEAWSDYRFTELEAEVEAEGGKNVFSIIPFLKKKQSGLRREQSLSKALKSSQERLILLEGDPGAGKSVALRYVAQSMARRAMKAKNLNTLIPIYVNLKELDRPKEASIDRNLIEKFVLHSLNRVNDRDIEEFLENEFHEGIRNGTWLFLFDSFDELPEILSSTEADETIRRYGDAISDFLHGMNQCRGIIASRQFRGPGRLGWPRFRILPLSEKRRSELIHRANLKTETEKEIIGQLGLALPEIRSMAINPMFLGLLCEHMKSERPFPKNAHSVFETYIVARLNRDEVRLWKRFNLKPTEVRKAAECIAFTMTADRQTGLSPSRETLKKSLMNTYGEITEKLDTYLDALEFIKLARSETATSAGVSKSFTFSHRRFQEYFATCVVLREPGLVSPEQLLMDARWRETAVTMFQTQPREVLSPILDEAQHIFAQIIDKIPGLIEDPMEYVRASVDKEKGKDGKQEEILPEPFSWPQGLLHICGLLQDGFSSHLDDLPQDIKMCSARIILTASEQGTLYDKKWGLELAGITPHPILLYLLRNAFTGGSQWLKEVAYRQVARLPEIPKDIALGISQALIRLLWENRLKSDIHIIRAHLARLDKSSTFLSVLNLLLWVPIIDLILHGLVFLLVFSKFIGATFSWSQFAVFLFLSLFLVVTYNSSILFRFYYKSDIKLINRRIMFNDGLIRLVVFLLTLAPLRLLSYSETFYFISLWGLGLYFIGWKPCALKAARSGQYTHPLFWPLLPLITPFIGLFKNVKTAFFFIKKKWRFFIPIFISTLLFSAGMKYFEEKFIDYIIFPSLTISMLLLIPSIFLLIRSWIRWKKWEKKKNKALSGSSFLMLINQYPQNSILQKYINTVREKSLLEASKEMEILLESLVVAVEQQKKAERIGTKVNKLDFENKIQQTISKSTDLAQWYESYANRNISFLEKVFYLGEDRRFPFAYRGNQLLDELSMLLEQVRLRRRD